MKVNMQLRMRAEAIRLAMASKPIRIGGAEVPITLSIGATVAPAGERAMLNILAVADVALYRAKNVGRNCTVYCEKPWSEILRLSDTPTARCGGCDFRISGECILTQPGLGVDVATAKALPPENRDRPLSNL